jgi:hypothetical protein
MATNPNSTAPSGRAITNGEWAVIALITSPFWAAIVIAVRSAFIGEAL